MDRRYVLSALVNNSFGVLSRISGLFSRRGYNIKSLTVGETTDKKISRMTIELVGDEYILSQIQKQLSKLEDVIEVISLDKEKAVFRELVLLKVNASDESRPAIIEIANIFRAKVVDISANSVIIEMTGDSSKIEAFFGMMEKFNIEKLARTGLTALSRGAVE